MRKENTKWALSKIRASTGRKPGTSKGLAMLASKRVKVKTAEAELHKSFLALTRKQLEKLEHGNVRKLQQALKKARGFQIQRLTRSIKNETEDKKREQLALRLGVAKSFDYTELGQWVGACVGKGDAIKSVLSIESAASLSDSSSSAETVLNFAHVLLKTKAVAELIEVGPLFNQDYPALSGGQKARGEAMSLRMQLAVAESKTPAPTPSEAPANTPSQTPVNTSSQTSPSTNTTTEQKSSNAPRPTIQRQKATPQPQARASTQPQARASTQPHARAGSKRAAPAAEPQEEGLHPSWVARQKKQQPIAFQGERITFGNDSDSE